MKNMHFKIEFKDGTEFSDSDAVHTIEPKEYAELVRSGRTGMDVDSIESISFWDDEGNVY